MADSQEEHKMKKKKFLLAAILLIASMLITSCGIPQKDYDAVSAERDAAQGKATSLQTQVDSLQNELDDAQAQVDSIEGNVSKLETDLSAAQDQISSLQSALNSANTSLEEAQVKLAKAEEVYKVILFYDDFEDGDSTGWNLEGGWSVVQEDNHSILKGVGVCSADIGPKQWTDYVLETRIKFNQSAIVNFRFTSDSQTYFLDILPEGAILYRQLTNATLLAKSALELQENKWFNLKIKVYGPVIDCYIDDSHILRYRDDNPLTGGTIGFELPTNSSLYVDDVIVMVVR
jgi:hypothetical protein